MEKPDFQKLIKKLQFLREHDRNFAGGGQTRSHQYQLSKPLQEEEIQTFEQKWCFTLPEQYRDFLKEVGGSGAGPYTLYPLAIEGELDAKKKNSLLQSFVQPTTPQELEAAINTYNQEADERYEQGYDEPGILIICNAGDAFNFGIVLNGQERGNIWGDSGCGYFIPERKHHQPIFNEKGQEYVANPKLNQQEQFHEALGHILAPYNASARIGFYDWYDQWLDDCLAALDG